MTDNELLLAISNMMDTRLNHINKNIQELREDIKDINIRVKDINIRVKNIELIQENKILPRLSTIESCCTSTYDRYKDSVDDYEAMKQDISVLKKVVTEHSEKLQKLA